MSFQQIAADALTFIAELFLASPPSLNNHFVAFDQLKRAGNRKAPTRRLDRCSATTIAARVMLRPNGLTNLHGCDNFTGLVSVDGCTNSSACKNASNYQRNSMPFSEQE